MLHAGSSPDGYNKPMEPLNLKLAVVGLGKLGGLLAESFVARGLTQPKT